MNLKEMSDEQLQALGYRTLVSVENGNLLLRLINEELKKRKVIEDDREDIHRELRGEAQQS